MKLHKNAALTPSQRKQIKGIYATRQFSYPQLAVQFNITVGTLPKWVKQEDCQEQSCSPKIHNRRVSQPYRQAFIDYRLAKPHYGPIRIERELRAEYDPSAFSTIRLILGQYLPQSPNVHL